MPLLLDGLSKSIEALQRALCVEKAYQKMMDDDLQATLRVGVIQCYEVAYEQCWKFMQRWIQENQIQEEALHPRTRNELFRMAARYGLVSDPLPWFEFGKARNLTSHTYNESNAVAVHDTVERFLPYALEFLQRIQEQND